MSNPPNVLIVCEHASSLYGGEAMLPLNYFKLVSERLPNVYLLTHGRVRNELDSLEGIAHDRIFYIPDTKVHQWLNKWSHILPTRVSLITFGAVAHFITQVYQWRLARRIIRDKAIHVVHEPAPLSPKQPSMMFALGVPVVMGPMNGGMTFPPAFSFMAGPVEKLLYGFMRMLSNVYNLMIPGKLYASVLLVANKKTEKALPWLTQGYIEEIVENGVYSARIRTEPKPIDENAVVNVLFVGRLVDWKAVDIIIDAIFQCKSNVSLTIVGSGPEREALEAQSNRYEDKTRVHFAGAVPFSKLTECYDSADIFVLPSVRESGGAVVLEAMARGLPVVATGWGGPLDYITPETGIVIDPVSRSYLVDEFARAIDQLSKDTELRDRMGRAAITHVKNKFTWEAKVDRVIELYKLAIATSN